MNSAALAYQSLVGLSVADALGNLLCFQEWTGEELPVDPSDFQATFWRSLQAGGDQDTICAISCGIVAARTPAPADWVQRREPFPREIPPP